MLKNARREDVSNDLYEPGEVGGGRECAGSMKTYMKFLCLPDNMVTIAPQLLDEIVHPTEVSVVDHRLRINIRMSGGPVTLKKDFVFSCMCLCNSIPLNTTKSLADHSTVEDNMEHNIAIGIGDLVCSLCMGTFTHMFS